MYDLDLLSELIFMSKIIASVFVKMKCSSSDTRGLCKDCDFVLLSKTCSFSHVIGVMIVCTHTQKEGKRFRAS